MQRGHHRHRCLCRCVPPLPFGFSFPIKSQATFFFPWIKPISYLLSLGLIFPTPTMISLISTAVTTPPAFLCRDSSSDGTQPPPSPPKRIAQGAEAPVTQTRVGPGTVPRVLRPPAAARGREAAAPGPSAVLENKARCVRSQDIATAVGAAERPLCPLHPPRMAAPGRGPLWGHRRPCRLPSPHPCGCRAGW